MALAAASSAQPVQLNPDQSDDSLTAAEATSSAPVEQNEAAFSALQPASPELLVTGYPGELLPTPEVGENPTSYPAGSENESNVSVIGSGSQNSESPASESTPTDQAMQGTVLLWGGCVLATLIFAASIFGSIYLYTRKRE